MVNFSGLVNWWKLIVIKGLTCMLMGALSLCTKTRARWLQLKLNLILFCQKGGSNEKVSLDFASYAFFTYITCQKCWRGCGCWWTWLPTDINIMSRSLIATSFSTTSSIPISVSSSVVTTSSSTPPSCPMSLEGRALWGDKRQKHRHRIGQKR